MRREECKDRQTKVGNGRLSRYYSHTCNLCGLGRRYVCNFGKYGSNGCCGVFLGSDVETTSNVGSTHGLGLPNLSTLFGRALSYCNSLIKTCNSFSAVLYLRSREASLSSAGASQHGPQACIFSRIPTYSASRWRENLIHKWLVVGHYRMRAKGCPDRPDQAPPQSQAPVHHNVYAIPVPTASQAPICNASLRRPQTIVCFCH